MEQWFANFNQVAKCVLVTVGFHWTLQRERVLLYSAFFALNVQLIHVLPMSQ